MDKLSWVKSTFGLFLLCAATAIALPAQTNATTFTTLHSFDRADGLNPITGLVQATDGNLYGTTEQGGPNLIDCLAGCGTVFKITPSGTLTMLYSFCSASGCADGNTPQAAPIQAENGNFYGTTILGGGVGDSGTVFRITPGGVLTTLHSFCDQSGCLDGSQPVAGVIQATNGNFYGITNSGGANGGGNFAGGTVFKITSGGTLTTLYAFCAQSGCTDGNAPDGGLVQAASGSFYGVTVAGGTLSFGTVFKITPGGALTTLHSFLSTDGAGPSGALTQAADGNFYGTASLGGTSHACPSGCGTVFRITPSGTFTTLHSFDFTDGESPVAGVIQATDGNFYGTTQGGGANKAGTVFKITPHGTLTVLHSFDGTDGAEPDGPLVQDTNGNFYGTTLLGGARNDGTVFSLSVGLGPFVETQPASGKVGKAVKILGTNLTGATSVTFNGTAATFAVKSSSLITTTVPVGATTGKVQVVTPSGTLSSNVLFRVLP